MLNRRQIMPTKEEWRQVILEDIVQCFPGAWGEETEFNNCIAMPIVGTGNISQEGNLSTIKAPIRFLTKREARAIVKEGDLMVVKSSGSASNIHSGKTAICPAGLSGKLACSNFVMRLVPNHRVVVPYILWSVLNSDYTKRFIQRIASGSTYPNIKWGVYKTLKISLPPLSQQKRIAKTLSTIQEAIETQDKIIGNLRELKKVVMEKVFTKGLDGEKTKQTEIGEIPEGWKVTELGKVGTFYGGGTPSTKNKDYWNGNIQWTTSKRITEKIYINEGERTITEEGLIQSSTSLIKKNNLLIATRVGVGKVAVNQIDVAISQDLTGIEVDNKMFTPEFIAYQLRTARIQKLFNLQKKGFIIQGLSRLDLKNVCIAHPALPEQKRITETLLTIDRKVEHHENKKTTLQDFFKVALNDLMKGED